MTRRLEKAVFLRSLNYLRISHAYAFRYNWLYPAAIGLVISILMVRIDSVEDLFFKGSLLPSFVPVLSVLAPFYIAALAAISTFSGSDFVDRPFEMSRPVTLEVIGKGGDWEKIEVTPRHFLSLLFGYCTTASIALLCVAIFSPFIASGVSLNFYFLREFVLAGIVFLFLFVLAQLLINTLLGVYYLSDRLHRR